MAKRYSPALDDAFISELAGQFGGPEELLSCLESLSRKLHDMLENVDEELASECPSQEHSEASTFPWN